MTMSFRYSGFSFAALAATISVACSGVDVASASKCHQLADLSCTLLADCRDIDKYECIAGFNAGISSADDDTQTDSCQKATGVRDEAEFEACITGLEAQIAAADCADEPPECSNQVKF